MADSDSAIRDEKESLVLLLGDEEDMVMIGTASAESRDGGREGDGEVDRDGERGRREESLW